MVRALPHGVRRRLMIAGMALLQGCSWSMPVSQPPTEGPRAANVGAQLPLSVGVYYDQAFLAFRRRATVTGGHSADLPVGETGAAEFLAACQRRFRHCARLASGAPLQGPDAAQYDLVVEPSIENAQVLPPGVLGWAGRWDIRLTWSFDVLSPAGGRIAEMRAHGQGSNEQGVDMSVSGLANSAEALALASRRVAENFLVSFPREPAIAARFPAVARAASP